jgi:hypothetical protein
MVPTVEFPPETPFTRHITPVLVVPVTVAVNCCDAEAGTVTLDGETDTLIVELAAVTLMLADADFDGSAVLVAVNVAEPLPVVGGV